VVKIYDILQNPEGEAYNRVVEYLLSTQRCFSLIWRGRHRHRETAYAVREELESVQVSSYSVDRWPGTRLGAEKATLLKYSCDPSVKPVLLRPGGLYSWLMPDYPEDLAFWSSDDTPVLSSVAHECMACVIGETVASALGQFIALKPRTYESEAIQIILGR
jgi:hypothetical protein